MTDVSPQARLVDLIVASKRRHQGAPLPSQRFPGPVSSFAFAIAGQGPSPLDRLSRLPNAIRDFIHNRHIIIVTVPLACQRHSTSMNRPRRAG